MAASAGIPAIGTDLGPCEGVCEHTDCAANRREANASCAICSKPIGYETRFYQIERDDCLKWYGNRLSPFGTVLENTIGKGYQLAHAICLERKISGG